MPSPTERRRYFRIDDTLKLSYQIIHSNKEAQERDTFDLLAEQDRRMEILIAEQKHIHPELIKLVALLNQKIERLTDIDRESKITLAYRARNVNISACGLAFSESEPLDSGTRLRLFLVLDNDIKMEVEGLLVDCKQEDENSFIWRVDFINLRAQAQEKLIQYVVRSQSRLLADKLNYQ